MGEILPPPKRGTGFERMEEVFEEVSRAEADEWDRLENLKRMMEGDPAPANNETDPIC
jgi:hypothetical protein